MSFVKKIVKKAFKVVKRYWKQILMVAAVVFTAGIATVGFAGFSSAAAAAGGGIGGFMSAVGSTFVAGGSAILGTVGIGSGVTAQTAGGAFANAGIVQGASSGLTLANGALAQGVGLAASTQPATGAILPGAGSATVPGTGVLTPGALQSSAAGQAAIKGAAGGLMPAAGQQAAAGGFLSSAGGRMLTAGIGNAAKSMMAARAAEDAEREEERRRRERNFYGMDGNGNAAGTNTPYADYIAENGEVQYLKPGDFGNQGGGATQTNASATAPTAGDPRAARVQEAEAAASAQRQQQNRTAYQPQGLAAAGNV